ncbi:hypothetical protein F5I97DRAFT_1798726 [Phlebopus sp. FC_14]|nr:hypothetical protein F5I97DRAFT_1798726 [Phlebopus sp. FC_14]
MEVQLDRDLAVGLASGSSSNKNINLYSPYFQCNQCPPASRSCTEASCIIPEITEECTEECLVVACDDPNHPDSNCQVTSGTTVCDGSCVTAIDCVECPGLNEFLQCCTDYHSYFSEPKSYEAPDTVRWDASFADLLCGCQDDAQAASIAGQPPSGPIFYPHSTLAQSLDILASDISVPSSSNTSSPSLLGVQTQFPDVNSQRPPLPPSVHMHCCMWADCGASFNTLSELVGHVNLEHLRAPGYTSQSIKTTAQLPSETSPPGQNILSCHWGDCAMYPTPSSIPSSSGPANCMLDVLTSHLMQDHLGLHHPLPSATNVQAVHAELASPLRPSGDSSTQSANPPVHECAGSHVCKWRSCAENFHSCEDLTAHIASVHVGSGKAHYDCFWEGCTRHGENGFPSKQKISRHLQSHTGHRPFQCKVCKQNFSEPATLQQHMRRHTQEKPYVCDHPGCGKAFAITGALTIHKRTHNGLRPFKCTYCDKAFSESSNLSKHLRTHTGVRPYPCTEDGCGKSFARPDQLARHMAVHRKKSNASTIAD